MREVASLDGLHSQFTRFQKAPETEELVFGSYLKEKIRLYHNIEAMSEDLSSQTWSINKDDYELQEVIGKCPGT